MSKQKHKAMKTTKNIYTNGKSLFTLENFDKSAGVCHVHGITLKAQVSAHDARVMHEKGQLHYVYGMGDRKELAGLQLNRRIKLNSFTVK